MKVVLDTNAKINIGLNVIKKREDGYHELEMIMVPIGLSDIIEIQFFNSEGNLKIDSPKSNIPLNEENIIYKIYNSFYEYTKLKKQKINVNLIKKIPTQAGLGGGSSNGAFFLKELNLYHGKILNKEEMIDIGKKVGADIPFFLENKSSLVKGIGEKLEILKNNLDCKILLIKPNFGVSTKDAFQSISKLEEKKYSNLSNIILGLETNNIDIINKNIENTLQQALKNCNTNIMEFEKKLDEFKELKFFMSGSGSCYFTLLTKDCSDKYYMEIKQEFKNCFIHLCEILN